MNRMNLTQKAVLCYMAGAAITYLLKMASFETCAIGLLVCNTCLLLDMGVSRDPGD